MARRSHRSLEEETPMPKTASDPTNREPISAGRKAMVFGASYSGNTDLPTVSSSLIISASAAGTVDVIMARLSGRYDHQHPGAGRHGAARHAGPPDRLDIVGRVCRGVVVLMICQIRNGAITWPAQLAARLDRRVRRHRNPTP